MRFFFWQNLTAGGYRSCKFLIFILWVIGFWCGAACAAMADIFPSLMRACCDSGVSIVGLFLIPFFPFLISAVAVYCNALLILYLTCFAKSFLLGFSICFVLSVFRIGGWLISFLLLFTDVLTVPALLRFQMRVLRPGGKVLCCDTFVTLLWFAAVSAVDHSWIQPLLREII